MLVPSMLASFVAYLEFSAVFGFTPMFGNQPGFDLRFTPQLIAFPVLGICVGLLARLYCWFFYLLVGWFAAKWRGPRPFRAAAAGFVTGCVGLAVPGVLGTGYGTIQDVLSVQGTLHLSVLVLIAMPFVKILGTSLSVGSGGSGGVFGPGLVIGATAGAALWRIAEPLGLAPASPAPLVIVGMAACLGAAARAPVAITLIAAETTGSFAMLAPATIAVPIAVMVFGQRTLYVSQPETREALAAARLASQVPPPVPGDSPAPVPPAVPDSEASPQPCDAPAAAAGIHPAETPPAAHSDPHRPVRPLPATN